MVAQVVDYENFPAVGGPIFEPSAPLGPPTNATAPFAPFGPPAPPTFAIITYTYDGAPEVDPAVYTTVPANDSLPYLPPCEVGIMYGLISDTFKPITPIVPPPATLRVYMTVSMDTWGILGRDNLNEMAYYPDPDYVPLLVGMYNGEITIDETTISDAAANNGFSNQTGSYVIDKTTVIEIVLKNQVGTDGFSVPHPVRHTNFFRP